MKCFFVPQGGDHGTDYAGVLHSDLQVTNTCKLNHWPLHLPLAAAFFKWTKFQFGLNPNSASNLFL